MNPTKNTSQYVKRGVVRERSPIKTNRKWQLHHEATDILAHEYLLEISELPDHQCVIFMLNPLDSNFSAVSHSL